MAKHSLYLRLGLGVLLTSQVFAETTTATLPQAQGIQHTLEQSLTTQVAQSATPWSEWGLTQEDWTRYEELKKGARGVWSPSLDPLTTLGIEARSEAERMRYAKLLAQKEFQRVEKEFAFQIAYSKAFEQLYPNLLPFSMDDNTVIPASHRILYFTRTDCETCAQDLMRLWQAAGNRPVDIYVIDSLQDDNRIRDWAVKNHIDIEKVKSRQVTLNHDKGYWLKYANGKMPAAFVVQGEGQWITFPH